MIENRINISQTFGNRLDVSFYRDRFDFLSKSYPSYPLQQLLEVNPSVSYKHLADSDDISFVPMEVVDEINGVIAEQRITKVSNNKGFTKFEDNDLLWAKITPCMQNGKSAIARNLVNGCGCGSTEFFVLRPKTNNILIEYVHYLLRDKKVLESAKNSFGGSAGQQRVSSSYLKSIKIPLPPMEVQQRIVDIYSKASEQKRAKEQEAQTLLDSIDSYLLGELGITLPETSQRQLAFKVNISEMFGNRYDPQFYNPNFMNVVQSIKSVPCKSLSHISKFSNETWNQQDMFDDFFPYIEISSINTNNGNIEEVNIVEKNNAPSRAKKIIQKDDILISTTRPNRGAITKVVENYAQIASTGFAVIRTISEEISRDYLLIILRGSISLKQMIQRSSGGNYPAITEDELSKIYIPIPPLAKQNEIAETISTIRAKASALQAEASAQLATAKAQIEKIILG